MFAVPKARPKKAVKGWQLVGRGVPSASPGPAKAASAGNASKAELEALAARNGWAPRALTYEDVQRMSSAELRFHEIWNSEALNEAFKQEEARRYRKESVPRTRIQLAWNGHSTAQEDELAYRAGNEFTLGTPSFPRTNEAATLIADYMKRNLMDATRVESYLQAWKALTEEGKITPLPYQSADAFYNEHQELHPTQKPPLIQAKEAKAEATKAAFANAESNTASAGFTNFTDYPERERIGYGNHTRYSFRKLLDSLDADSYQRRLIEDPSFAAAVDKIAEK